MKIFLFTDEVSGGARLLADCSLLRDTRPFFVPDTAPSWRYSAGVAWQIGRLGKNIGGRFASRYIDGAYACVLTAPLPDAPGDFGRCHEGAIIVGEPLPFPPAPFEVETTTGLKSEVVPSFEEACRMVAEASRYTTLKTGDLIVSSVVPLAVDLPLDSAIIAPGLRARIK